MKLAQMIPGPDQLSGWLSYALNFTTALVLLAAGIWLSRTLSRTAARRLAGVKDFDPTLVPVVEQTIRYALLAITAVLVLAEFGVQTASIITVLGAAGLAIGLALQGTLQNVAAGIMLLLLRPFRAGDYIEAGDAAGTVEEIGFFLTHLRTPQNIFKAVPNSRIFAGTITNYSNLTRRRLDLTIGIAYDDDIDRGVEILKGLVDAEPRILSEPAPKVLVRELGESAVDLQIRAWAAPADFWDVRSSLVRAVKYALDDAGISIPYPHRQIVMTGALPARRATAAKPRKPRKAKAAPAKADPAKAAPGKSAGS